VGAAEWQGGILRGPGGASLAIGGGETGPCVWVVAAGLAGCSVKRQTGLGSQLLF